MISGICKWQIIKLNCITLEHEQNRKLKIKFGNMSNEKDTKGLTISANEIQNRIYTIRGMQVMMDRDLAEFYLVENKRLNEQVKRNSDRFPDKFMFQLTANEWDNLKMHTGRYSNNLNLRSQFATSSHSTFKVTICDLKPFIP